MVVSSELLGARNHSYLGIFTGIGDILEALLKLASELGHLDEKRFEGGCHLGAVVASLRGLFRGLD